MCWIVEGIWYFEIAPYWSITLIIPPLMAVESEYIYSPNAQRLGKYKGDHGNISEYPLQGRHLALMEYYEFLKLIVLGLHTSVLRLCRV